MLHQLNFLINKLGQQNPTNAKEKSKCTSQPNNYELYMPLTSSSLTKQLDKHLTTFSVLELLLN
jgi:hypothetical protein